MSNKLTARYNAALAFLNGTINYEKKMPELYAPEKMDPARPGRLLEGLGNPHAELKALHIAGTKGKGSTAAMAAFALRAAGLRVGLFTSPHLIDVRERIRILTPDDADGRIGQEEFAAAVETLQPIAERFAGLTWFELMTAVGFIHFARAGVDAAVVEVGLGGRLDATNVLCPVVSVITRISLDHTALLGENVAAIAAEKGGIIKPGIPAVTAPQPAAALDRLETIAARQMASLTVVGRDVDYAILSPSPLTVRLTDRARPGSLIDGLTLTVPLAGAHQAENAAVAATALRVVAPVFPGLNASTLAAGIGTTLWPGRFQLLRAPDASGPGVVVDGAHNGESAARLADAVRTLYPGCRLHLLLAMTEDKDLAAILRPLLSLAATTVVTATSHPRAAPAAAIKAQAAALGTDAGIAPDPVSGLRFLWENASPGDLILATGSLFLVGDLLNQWERLQSQIHQTRAGGFPGQQDER